MTDFLKDIIKSSGNEYAGVASEGIDGSDVTGFIDTGSYAFNALLSGSLYGGIPNNKIMNTQDNRKTHRQPKHHLGKVFRNQREHRVQMLWEMLMTNLNPMSRIAVVQINAIHGTVSAAPRGAKITKFAMSCDNHMKYSTPVVHHCPARQ